MPVEGPTATVDAPPPDNPSMIPSGQGAACTGSMVTLHDSVRALMSGDDPSQLIIRVEVRSFFSYLATVIDTLLSTGLSLHQFRPFLDSRVASIRDAGYPELARIIADDLDHLEAKFQSLQDFEAAGFASYAATETEVRLRAWRDACVFAGHEVQMQRDHAHRLEIAVAEASSSVGHLQSCIAAGEMKILELEQELQAAKESLSVLKLTKANKEEVFAVMSKEFGLSKQKLAEIEEETAKMLHSSEESFRAELQEKLQQAFFDKVSGLRQQIYYHKFDV